MCLLLIPFSRERNALMIAALTLYPAVARSARVRYLAPEAAHRPGPAVAPSRVPMEAVP